jgi:hypothetical protein
MVGATNLAMANETSSNEWEFSATPLFLWGMSIDGDATIRYQQISGHTLNP